MLGTSTGLAVGGVAIEHLQSLEGWTALDAYRAMFWIYTGIGCIKAIIALLLSSRCEHTKEPAQRSNISDETEPLLNGSGSVDVPETASRPPKPVKARRRFLPSINTISKPSRSVLFKLCSLFFFDSLGSGMVPFSLINYYMQRKFALPQGKLGGIMSATW